MPWSTTTFPKYNTNVLELRTPSWANDGATYLHCNFYFNPDYTADSYLRLDDRIGSNLGTLSMGGQNFSKSARNIKLNPQNNNNSLLYCEISGPNGWQGNNLDLSPFITLDSNSKLTWQQGNPSGGRHM